jgi:Tfp pilus assembly protein PilF
MKSKQYQRVKDLLHKYASIQPSNAQVFCLMAEVLQQTNDVEHAKSWSVKAKLSFRLFFVFDFFSGIYKH